MKIWVARLSFIAQVTLYAMDNIVNTEDIDVVVLCGGRGERLQSLLSDRPKVLAEINGQPFLDILIDYVASFGFKRFILCIGYMADLIKRHYQYSAKTLNILFSEEKEPLGTAGAIKNAEPLIISNPFLVMNGDSLCRLNLNEFIDFHIKKKALFSIVLSNVQNRDDCGKVVLDKLGRVTGFNEKVKSKSTDNFVNAGMYLLDKSIFSEIPKDKNYSLEYEVFPKMVNRRFYGFVTQERFIDIGIPERFKQARVEL